MLQILLNVYQSIILYCNNSFPSASELWLTLFSQLGNATIDSRPEVRNSALRTIILAFTSHGDKLECWELLISNVLQPMFENIHKHASNAEKIVNESTSVVKGISGKPKKL